MISTTGMYTLENTATVFAYGNVNLLINDYKVI